MEIGHEIIDHEIISLVILSLLLIYGGQLAVTDKSMCTKYWLMVDMTKPAREKCE